ncbi:MAG TPA: WecB/TagA/CpsF family glycosyltransferase, partial [Verrucomicrobiae bacterium]|nr:WecB/TagA/CpsF family glycosyltransferase [Verrucomicrobiae bacterium]
KQELWIDAARDLPISTMVGIGGTFGFYTTKKRAPKLFRALHLEWLFRALTEPGHAKRAWRAVVVFSCVALMSLTKRKHS